MAEGCINHSVLVIVDRAQHLERLRIAQAAFHWILANVSVAAKYLNGPHSGPCSRRQSIERSTG